MKKILTLIFATAIALNCSFANNEPKEENNNSTPVSAFQYRYNNGPDNWFISVGVGAQVYFGDHDKQTSVGKRITPKFEISGGKWLSQSFGLRANVNTAKMKGLTQTIDGKNGLTTGKKYRDEDHLWHQDFQYINVHVDFLFNWTNDAYGYDPKRMYNLIPYAGIGLMTATTRQKGYSFSPNLGVLQSFKINDQFGINLDVKGNIFADKVDGELGGRNFEGAVSVMAGLSYTIK